MPQTEDYLINLEKDRANLIKNLSKKGEEVKEDDTFTKLAPKVLNIGKKDIWVFNIPEIKVKMSTSLERQ